MPKLVTTIRKMATKNKRCSSAGRFYTSSAGAVTSLILTFVFCEVAYADTPSITINVSSDIVAMDMLLDSSNGTFASSDDLNISVSTNNSIGYTLGFKADDTTNTTTGLAVPLINAESSSLTIPSIASTVSATDFSANNATGATYNDKWGYLPSKFDSVANSSTYYPAPTIAGDVLDVTGAANNVANNYTISFGTRISAATAPGTYSNTFVITAVANFAQYSINYYAGTGSSDATLANMPVNETGYILDETLPLSKHIPTRNTYAFLGWCDGNITTTDNIDSCSGTVYPAGGNNTVSQYSNTTMNLYAMWSNRLYDKVASMTKGTQIFADMQAVITEPTSSDPLLDTSNSGVFTYDASYYGVASDASNDYPIYYYRGWLDRTFASEDEYGGIPSTGDSGYYPNYVRLSDTTSNKVSTCWRIVRTTGSGGVKMIYNGVWTGDTCANATRNAAAGIAYFNKGAGFEATGSSACNTADNAYCGTFGFTTLVGYNYNSNYVGDGHKVTTFISNSTLFNNDTASNLRSKTEEWYNNTSNLSVYASNNKLETSAGWCDDRTTSASPTVNDTTVPYSDAWLAFGSRLRNTYVGSKLTLVCPNVTGNDLLTTANGLGAPLAQLTLDEAALVGNGFYHYYDNSGSDSVSQLSSNYSYKSFLRSGGYFWLLSSDSRSNSGIDVSHIVSYGSSANAQIFYTFGIRPTISLSPGIHVTSGSGTSTDPWVIPAQ